MSDQLGPGDKAADGGVVRVMTRRANRSTSPNPSRFSVAISTTPENSDASKWEEAQGGLAAILGHRIAAKTGKPVGIVFMQSATGKEAVDPPLKSWISAASLNQAPSLMEDYKSCAVELGHWLNANAGDKEGEAAAAKQLLEFIDKVVAETYK